MIQLNILLRASISKYSTHVIHKIPSICIDQDYHRLFLQLVYHLSLCIWSTLNEIPLFHMECWLWRIIAAFTCSFSLLHIAFIWIWMSVTRIRGIYVKIRSIIILNCFQALRNSELDRTLQVLSAIHKLLLRIIFA